MKKYAIQHIQVRAESGSNIDDFIHDIAKLALDENRIVIGIFNDRNWVVDPQEIKINLPV